MFFPDFQIKYDCIGSYIFAINMPIHKTLYFNDSYNYRTMFNTANCLLKLQYVRPSDNIGPAFIQYYQMSKTP